MNCSVYTMQIIIPKWAYKIVELEDGTYLVIIDEAFYLAYVALIVTSHFLKVASIKDTSLKLMVKTLY